MKQALKVGEYELRGDTVYRVTAKNCSLPVSRIYGQTHAIRARIFNALFTNTDLKGYDPLAHASVHPIEVTSDTPSVSTNRPAGEIGYDVREGVPKSKVRR